MSHWNRHKRRDQKQKKTQFIAKLRFEALKIRKKQDEVW